MVCILHENDLEMVLSRMYIFFIKYKTIVID
jgi:hypothetical protein